jgi:ribonucleotide monophosphatase NagD (HAD superfamily)
MEKFDVYFFDCDGVLYEGETALPFAGDTIKRLRVLGRKVYFITNGSGYSRVTIA